jgi:hypothetical protein
MVGRKSTDKSVCATAAGNTRAGTGSPLRKAGATGKTLGARGDPGVGLFFNCAEMAVLTISLALAVRPFGKLAVDWTDVWNERPVRAGVENQKDSRE